MGNRLLVLPPVLTSLLALLAAAASVSGSSGVTAGGTALALLGVFGLQVCWVLYRLAGASGRPPAG